MGIRRHGDEFQYHSERPRSQVRHSVHYRLGDLLGPSPPNTLEFFFLERYLLFVERHGQIQLGQVHHSPYPAQRAEILRVEDDLAAAAGLSRLAHPPAFAHYASGVDVEVFDLQPA
jgi:uncharacterized protein YqjF (DUF2071 family)